MEIKIENYLDEEAIKDILIDELRLQVRNHFINEQNAKRLLSNLAYEIVTEEVNKIIPNYHEELVNKIAKLIKEKDLTYHVFNFGYSSGAPESLGAKILEQTVRENQQLIKDRVVEAIQNKDYSEEALITMERLSDNFASNIYDFVELMRNKK